MLRDAEKHGRKSGGMMSKLPFCNMGEVAEILGVSNGSVARILRNEGIKVIDWGRAKVVSREEIEGFAEHYDPTPGRPRNDDRKPAKPHTNPKPPTAVKVVPPPPGSTMEVRRAKLKAAIETIRRKQR